MSSGYAQKVIDVSVAYATDIDAAMSVMREVATEMRRDPALAPRILEDLEIAGVDQWADAAVIIRSRFRVKPLEQWTVRREYLRRLKAAFDRANIEIPFPQLKLHLPPTAAAQ